MPLPIPPLWRPLLEALPEGVDEPDAVPSLEVVLDAFKDRVSAAGDIRTLMADGVSLTSGQGNQAMDIALSALWSDLVVLGETDSLVTLLRIGLVPPTPLVVSPEDAHSEATLPLLTEALAYRQVGIARWLARSPALIEDAALFWDPKELFCILFYCEPEVQVWLLTLPLGWDRVDSEENTVFHVFFDELDDLVEQEGSDDSEAEIEAQLVQWTIPRLAKVCPLSHLGHKNADGFGPYENHRGSGLGTEALQIWCTALAEEVHLGEKIAASPPDRPVSRGSRL
jgi:hypothetical protein